MPFLCALAFAVNVSAGPADAGKAAGPLDNAVKAYEQGQTGKALDICLEGLNKNPADRELYLYAVEILPEGHSKRAASLHAITAGAPAADDDYIYHFGLCKIYRNSGQAPEALSNCKRAMEREPTAWPVYRELGLTYSKNGKHKKAVETLSQGVELSSDNYKAYYYLAAEYEKTSDRPRALKNYLKALALVKKAADFDARSYSGIIRGKIKRLSVKKGMKRPRQASKKAAARPRMTFDACVSDAQESERKNDLAAAEKKLSACAGLMPQNAQVRLERANLLARLGKYEPAGEEYQRAAALFGKKDPPAPHFFQKGQSAGQAAPGDSNQAMAAFCHIKTAQTWSKLGDQAKTALYYQKALEINKNELNALLGLAGAYEAKADLAAAAALYERVLKVEPSNAKAKERLDDINFSLLSNAGILSELKERKAVDAAKTELSEEDLNTVKTMRQAEKRGAIDFLKGRAPLMNGLIVVRQVRGGVKLMLTMAGFKAYQSYLTRDAVGFFEKKGITLSEVFVLKDLKGKPIFDPAGNLTGDGMAAYWQAQAGTKSWLMPYEAPASVSAAASAPVKENPETEQALKDGYREISEPEFSWLLSATECPVETLTEKPGEILKLIKAPKRQRYFLCYMQGAICAMKGTNKLATYIENYRRGDTHIPETKATAFFGAKVSQGRRFCHNGKIWMGD
ncbi:MAG: tetratricopeptide repeat protein [Elusimicrobia bacterium]|nr:tetratricopeptide repeat protein [Elusimicrobiota bacterium]